ncbi:Iron-sulfur assembly protein 1 [Xylographa opegraphella]|nr:Iron-sulfur assembly protein 1 [Xylographa opegraphella]
MSIRLSSKRKLVTASAYHPKTLDSTDLPPRNTGIPDSSIAGGIPQVNDIRPPQVPVEYRQYKDIPNDEKPRVSVTEGEAQKPKPIAETSTSSAMPKSKRPKLRARKAAMNLTPTAISHLRELLEQPEPKLIRVGVKNRGCSGLAYHLEYVEKPGTFDETVEQDGVKVLIDSKALFSIIGSEMDWVEDKLNQRFVFRNPNIKEQCGCGESFMV